MRPTGTVMQAVPALRIKPGNPPVGALPRDSHLLCHVRHWPVIEPDSLNKQAAAVKRQAGISVTH